MDTDQYRPAKAEKYNGREESQDRPHPNDAYRRRSPGNQNRRPGPRGGRNRSRSPVAIDRYEPDRTRDDYSRDFGRERESRRRPQSPPAIDRYVPGQDDPLPPPVRSNPLPNPLMLDYQVGFNFFAEWWRAERDIKEDEERVKNGGRRTQRKKADSKEEREAERAQIQAAYDTYKEELQAKMAKAFVLQHKTQEWFKERYLPEVRDPLRTKLTTFRQSALDQWENDLSTGVFDEFSLEGIYKAESNGAGGVLEREEGETVAAAEVLGVGDLVPSRGGDIRDESASQPALLIKTLAPMVSREKIEDLCKEHLGEADGGFKWLSLSDPNPSKKCHRIGWIMLHPESENDAMVVERGDGRDNDEENGENGEEAKPSVALTTAEKALEAINGKTIHDEVRGDFTCHVGVHVPPREPRKKALWDLFSAPQRIERDLQLAKRIVSKFDSELGDHADGVAKVNARVEALQAQGALQPVPNGTNGAKKSRKNDDGDEEMKAEFSEDEGEASDGEEEEDDDNDDEDLLLQKKTLDLLVEYLRRVYNFCFFCVFESDSVHELIRKCPGGHLRRPRASLSTSAKAVATASAAGQPYPAKRQDSNLEETNNDASPTEEKRMNFRGPSKTELQLQRAFNWVKTFEEKLLQLLEPENVDLKKLGGAPVEEGLEEELKKFFKQEDENKFRCKVPECTKLFKSESFWKKHVEKRHDDWFQGISKDLELINNYLLDPAHIAPSRSDANSNGHFPINNQHMQAGTPRGFNLQSMPGMPNFPGMIPPGGFSGFGNFGGNQSIGNNWSGQGSGDGGSRQPGPMRRGGGRFNQQRGPYDRRGGRFGSNGRISPRGAGAMGGIMAGGRSAGGPHWDAISRGAAPPPEALAGRTIKAYDDLDDVGGGGAAELNY